MEVMCGEDEEVRLVFRTGDRSRGLATEGGKSLGPTDSSLARGLPLKRGPRVSKDNSPRRPSLYLLLT